MYPATNFGIHRAKEVRPTVQALSDLCLQLSDYAATVKKFALFPSSSN